MGPKLWEALADVLQLMTQQACPDAFHQGDGITQLTQTAAFLQESDKQHDPNNYILFNQDLAGFFTSVDKDRFFAAYSILARWYRDENHQHADTFYIDHCQKAPLTPGTPRQKQTKTTGSIFRKQTWHSPQGHPTTHQRCPSFELLCGRPNTH